MPQVKSDADLFGGMETEQRGENTTVAVIDGFRAANGKTEMRAQTTSRKSEEIARVTARYKLCREAAKVAPLDDRETWERRRDIAEAEMQIQRFREALALEEAKEPRNDLQVKHLQTVVATWMGKHMMLIGQEAVPGADVRLMMRRD